MQLWYVATLALTFNIPVVFKSLHRLERPHAASRFKGVISGAPEAVSAHPF